MIDTNALLTRLSQAFNQRDWPGTRMLANQLLPDMPQHPLLRYISGVAEMELQNMPMALTHLHIATDLEPRRPDFAVQFAKALVLVKMMHEAREAANRAMAVVAVADAATLDTLGVVYTQTHAHAEAAEAFRRAVALKPDHAPYRFNLATALVAVGELDAAEMELETCIRIEPRWWKAHLTLAQLHMQTADSNHIARMEALLTGHDDDLEAQTYLHMALAKEREDCADYPAAFTHYMQGKAAAGKGRGYRIEHDEALFAAITAAFPVPQAAVPGCPSNEPIFVIGMPRSGTTLVERIISSHPDVHSAGELMNFGVALKRASGSRTPLLLDADTIGRARELDWAAVGADYLASTRPATGQTPRFIDKLPHNFLYAGWIARALPNAKIICLRRDPLDTCLSNFRQLFAPQSPYYAYSFDLDDTGRYYALFDCLISHWQRAFPGRILEVRYEDLVESQEAGSRQLLDFCGLPWHDDCLRFEQNAAPVNTASAVQVRGPVYRSALQRWRKYEPQLGRLRDVLSRQGIELPV
ncbi:tetratricopeptide repeat-containing sulfotransferase family protein [Rhodanobacter geophilus]|uniref:Sulfotransferase n=1 Tax=Rhodanobacter geophilus TaxID=3162488 RepID=A0ABV3QLT1_9GAMM